MRAKCVGETGTDQEEGGNDGSSVVREEAKLPNLPPADNEAAPNHSLAS